MAGPSLVPKLIEKQRGFGEELSPRQESRLWPVLSDAAGEPVAWTWVVGLVTVATVLRVVALNQQLWFDEIVTLLNFAREPVSRIVTQYDGQNQHMLYSLLAHSSIRLFGEHAWSLRLPAMVFGVASVPALYFFGRLVTTNRESLFASALMVVNYQHVWFSQNARGYTGMLFWTLLASIFFIRCTSNGKTRDWVFYGLAAALGIYTHLMMTFVVAGHVILYAWLLASRARSGRQFSRSFLLPLYGFVLCGVVSLLLYAPVMPLIFARTVGVAAHDSASYEWASPLWAIAELFRGLRTGTGGGIVGVLAGGLILCGGLLSYWRGNRFLVGLFLLPGLATSIAVLATRHNFWPRFFFFEIGFALLLLVRGVTVLAGTVARILGGTETLNRRLSAAMLVVILLASLVPLRAAYLYPKQDYLGAMKFVQDQRRPDEQVITMGIVTMPYQLYYGLPWPRVETPAQLHAVLDGNHATWLIYAMPAAIRASQSEIWSVTESKFILVRRFPGTLSGGDIYVSKSSDRREPVNPAR